VISNEKGRIHGLPSNREINGNMYVGTLIVAGCNENGEFCSLSSLQSEAYKQLLGLEKELNQRQMHIQRNGSDIVL
jgi:hypothetical protein